MFKFMTSSRPGRIRVYSSGKSGFFSGSKLILCIRRYPIIDIEKDYYSKLDELRRRIKSPKNFQSAMELALEIHTIIHTGEVSSSNTPTFCNELLDGLEEDDYSVMPTGKEIIGFSKQVKKQELINYRNAVGRQTRGLLKALTPVI